MNALKRYELAMARKARSMEGKTPCYWCNGIATAKWNGHDYCYACLQRAYQREDGEAKGKPVSCQCPKCKGITQPETLPESHEEGDAQAAISVALSSAETSVVPEDQPSFPPVRRRGRPKGSKNKSKTNSVA